MSDDPRKPIASVVQSHAHWTARCRRVLAAVMTAAVRLARWSRRRQTGSRSASQDVPQDLDAVIDILAGPVIAWLSPAALRLQQLTAADVAALSAMAELQLAQVLSSLRLHYAALSARAAADRTVHAAIDLPQAMRMDVQATRGKAAGEGAA